MSAFSYPDSPDPIRADLAEAYRWAWAHIAASGTWLSGAERVAVAEETRRARRCGLCRERKAALSPFAVDGEHDHSGALPAPMIDAVHRVTTDASRLSRAWYSSLLADGLSAEQYVEALGVTVLTISIDEFHHAMGLAPEPLPEPAAGEPSRATVPRTEIDEVWVPVMDVRKASREQRALLGTPPGVPKVPNVIRALSLVPEQVNAWVQVANAQYLSPDKMLGFETGRAIDRAQMELVAGRTSSLNECFY